MALVLGTMVWVSCTPSMPSGSKGGDPSLAPFAHVADGARYVFDVHVQDAKQSTLSMDGRRTKSGSLELSTTVAKLTMTVGSDAVTSGDGRVLLKLPLTLGAEWDEKAGVRARVDAVDLSVTVPAGTYAGCVRVTSRIQSPGRGVVTTTYCPGVGRVIWTTDDEAPKRHVARFELARIETTPK